MPTPTQLETPHDSICDCIAHAADISDHVTSEELIRIRLGVLAKWNAMVKAP